MNLIIPIFYNGEYIYRPTTKSKKVRFINQSILFDEIVLSYAHAQIVEE